MQTHLLLARVSTDPSPWMSVTDKAAGNGARRAPSPLLDDSLFRLLIEHATDTVFLIDLRSEECIYVSPAIGELLGRDAREMIGRPLTDFVHPDDVAEVHARSDRRRRGQAVRSTLTRMSSADDHWVWVQAAASPVCRYRGRTVTVFTVTGAAERVRAEVGLRNSQLRLQRLLERLGADGPLSTRDGSPDLMVEVLAAALELRDDKTGQHARRVSALALALTEEVDSELARNPELRYGYLLHDIGKIGIPDSILLNPGPLSARDVRTLRMHTTLGENLVACIPFVSTVAHDIVAFHHERWDGHGYPSGLAGEDIPLAARIFAVADTFDAITNDRPFRPARPMRTASALIEAGAGGQFDPFIVRKFLPIAAELAAGHWRQAAARPSTVPSARAEAGDVSGASGPR